MGTLIAFPGPRQVEIARADFRRRRTKDEPDGHPEPVAKTEEGDAQATGPPGDFNDAA